MSETMTMRERAARWLAQEDAGLDWERASEGQREHWMGKAGEFLESAVPPATGRTSCKVDMTGPEGFQWAEILTDAGIIRVNVGLVNTRSGAQAVVVEVDYNQEDVGRFKTPPGGNWDTEVRADHALGNRIEVVLTRRP